MIIDILLMWTQWENENSMRNRWNSKFILPVFKELLRFSKTILQMKLKNVRRHDRATFSLDNAPATCLNAKETLKTASMEENWFHSLIVVSPAFRLLLLSTQTATIVQLSLNSSQNPSSLLVQQLSHNKGSILWKYLQERTQRHLSLPATRREESHSSQLFGTKVLFELFFVKSAEEKQNPIMLWPSSQLEWSLPIGSRSLLACFPYLLTLRSLEK